MKKRFDKNCQGFTLIELLVTLFIIVLLVIAFIPFYRQFGIRSGLRTEANRVKNFINHAKILAIAPEDLPGTEDDNIRNQDSAYYYFIDYNNYTLSSEEVKKARTMKLVLDTDIRPNIEPDPYIVDTLKLNNNYNFRRTSEGTWNPFDSQHKLGRFLAFKPPSGEIEKIDLYDTWRWMRFKDNTNSELRLGQYTYLWVQTEEPISGNLYARIEITVDLVTGSVSVGEIEEVPL